MCVNVRSQLWLQYITTLSTACPLVAFVSGADFIWLLKLCVHIPFNLCHVCAAHFFIVLSSILGENCFVSPLYLFLRLHRQATLSRSSSTICPLLFFTTFFSILFSQVSRHANYTRLYSLCSHSWHCDAILPQLELLQPEDIAPFVASILTSCHVESLLHGNMTAEEGLLLAKQVRPGRGGTLQSWNQLAESVMIPVLCGVSAFQRDFPERQIADLILYQAIFLSGEINQDAEMPREQMSCKVPC